MGFTLLNHKGALAILLPLVCLALKTVAPIEQPIMATSGDACDFGVSPHASDHFHSIKEDYTDGNKRVRWYCKCMMILCYLYPGFRSEEAFHEFVESHCCNQKRDDGQKGQNRFLLLKEQPWFNSKLSILSSLFPSDAKIRKGCVEKLYLAKTTFKDGVKGMQKFFWEGPYFSYTKWVQAMDQSAGELQSIRGRGKQLKYS
jgi:hypothetical protein